MMRVSLNNIVNATDTFSKIMQQSFKGSLAFKIARLVRELKKELDTFNEERRKLLDKYCVKDEMGEDDSYTQYAYLYEDEQSDDLTMLALKRI